MSDSQSTGISAQNYSSSNSSAQQFNSPPPSSASSSSSSNSSSHPNLNNLIRLGESLFSSSEKINSELFTLTYGALIVQLLKDYRHVELVNSELDRMGFSIGERIIDEFLAKSSIAAPNFNLTIGCSNFRDTAYFLSKVAFKMFLGVTAEVGKFSADGKQFSIIIRNNPIVEAVEVPNHIRGLKYSNILAGVIRGSLQQVQLSVETELISSFGATGAISEEEIRVCLKEIIQETFAEEE